MLHFINKIENKNLKINLDFFKFNSKSSNEIALIEIYNLIKSSSIKFKKDKRKNYKKDDLINFQIFKKSFLNENKSLKQNFF